MRFSLILLSVVAASLFAVCNVSSAQNAKKATFDESLLEVQDGETVDYYKALLDDIQNSFNGVYNDFQEAVKDEKATDEQKKALQDDLAQLVGRIRGAQKTILANLVEIADLPPEEAASYLQAYASFLAQEQDIKGLRALEKRLADRPDLQQQITAARLQISINVAGEKKDKRALKAIAKEIREFALANPGFGPAAADMTKTIPYFDEKTGMDAIVELSAAFRASKNKTLVAAAAKVEGRIRFARLVGKDIRIEGLFLDGEEIDWEEYRDKVVLIDFWATWCGPCVGEIPNVKELYEKYHEAGFEVVGYSLDENLDELKAFEEKQEIPWKTLSRKFTLDEGEKAKKNYLDVADYYGISSIPTMILVDRDGKVIDMNARGDHLRELLENEFPDVE